MKRWIVALAVVTLSALGVAGPAAAADNYPPDNPPTLSVEAAAVCHGNAVTIDYAADVTGADAVRSGAAAKRSAVGAAASAGLTISLPRANGTVLTLHHQPLSGSIDLPAGWKSSSIDVMFSIGDLSETLTVALPLECGDTVVGSETTGRVPNLLGLTGAQFGGAIGAVVLLLAIGSTLLVVRRRAELTQD